MASRQWNAGGFLRQPRRADDFPAPGPSFPARFRRARRELKRRGASVASPIICRSALAIEAHRGVASLANTPRYGLRDAPCAALRWLAAPYDICPVPRHWPFVAPRRTRRGPAASVQGKATAAVRWQAALSHRRQNRGQNRRPIVRTKHANQGLIVHCLQRDRLDSGATAILSPGAPGRRMVRFALYRKRPAGGQARSGSILEASVHCVAVACRTSVLSALRLRVHERFRNGMNPEPSAPHATRTPTLSRPRLAAHQPGCAVREIPQAR